MSITHKYTNWCKGRGDEFEDDKDVVVEQIVDKDVDEEKLIKYSLNEISPSELALKIL